MSLSLSLLSILLLLLARWGSTRRWGVTALSGWSTWGWGILSGLRSYANVSVSFQGRRSQLTGHREHQEPDLAVAEAVRTVQIVVDRRNRLAGAEAVVVAVVVEVLLRKEYHLHLMLVLLLI
jgi:hypothetical protein